MGHQKASPRGERFPPRLNRDQRMETTLISPSWNRAREKLWASIQGTAKKTITEGRGKKLTLKQ